MIHIFKIIRLCKNKASNLNIQLDTTLMAFLSVCVKAVFTVKQVKAGKGRPDRSNRLS